MKKLLSLLVMEALTSTIVSSANMVLNTKLNQQTNKLKQESVVKNENETNPFVNQIFGLSVISIACNDNGTIYAGILG